MSPTVLTTVRSCRAVSSSNFALLLGNILAATRITSTHSRLFVQAVIETDEDEDTSLNPQLANFNDNEGHVVGEGTVPPRSYAVEDCLLHIREC
jgi:hypothetical protein